MKMKIIFGFGIVILLIGIISAVNVNIDMENSFGIGEEVSFNYTILSSTNENIQYIVSVNCPTAPLPLLEIKNVALVADSPLTENYIYMSEIKDDLISQTCTAMVGIISPTEVSANKSFTISTNPSFEFNLNLCKDRSCSNKSR